MKYTLAAAGANEMHLVRELFLEYADTLEFKLDFQGFADEVDSLPGKYAPPAGCVLLAFWENELAGCVALRPLDAKISEMKRLYVRPKFQGKGLGRALAAGIIAKAEESGYEKIRLDTVPSMEAALQMYRSMGFYEIAAYRENPVAGATYFERKLS